MLGKSLVNTIMHLQTLSNDAMNDATNDAGQILNEYNYALMDSMERCYEQCYEWCWANPQLLQSYTVFTHTTNDPQKLLWIHLVIYEEYH